MNRRGLASLKVMLNRLITRQRPPPHSQSLLVYSSRKRAQTAKHPALQSYSMIMKQIDEQFLCLACLGHGKGFRVYSVWFCGMQTVTSVHITHWLCQSSFLDDTVCRCFYKMGYSNMETLINCEMVSAFPAQFQGLINSETLVFLKPRDTEDRRGFSAALEADGCPV